MNLKYFAREFKAAVTDFPNFIVRAYSDDESELVDVDGDGNLVITESPGLSFDFNANDVALYHLRYLWSKVSPLIDKNAFDRNRQDGGALEWIFIRQDFRQFGWGGMKTTVKPFNPFEAGADEIRRQAKEKKPHRMTADLVEKRNDQGETVEFQVERIMYDNPTSRLWKLKNWADLLGCSTSGVAKTKTWKDNREKLKVVKQQKKNEFQKNANG